MSILALMLAFLLSNQSVVFIMRWVWVHTTPTPANGFQWYILRIFLLISATAGLPSYAPPYPYWLLHV